MDLPLYPPLPVDPDGRYRRDLSGAWSYAQPVPDAFPAASLPDDRALHAPGEIVMQGLPYGTEAACALEHRVAVPADWEGRRLRLRFEAVYSACEVYVNGRPAGAHLGGFTPFDLDVTDLVTAGQTARVGLRLHNRSVADLISFGSRYADHPLAGILRKATLYALPDRHLLDLAVATLFADGDHARATLRVDLTSHGATRLSAMLIAPDGQPTELGAYSVDGRHVLDFQVDRPVLWDTETPALYTLRLTLDGTVYERRVGFREIAVRNRQLALNGRRLWLRGVNHHETHPLTGRADTAGWAETDVRLLKAAHVNFLRTSHYPPTVELVEACDAAGLLLEVEAPICFAFGQFDYMPGWDDLPPQEQAEITEHIVTASREMVAFYRSHPSVILWSVANESHWAPPFARSAAAIRAADPTRPLTFNWWRLESACRGHVEVANHHYPEAGQVAAFAQEPRPILFDEFAHLFCYNDRELATDPGLRELWGGFLDRQWGEILDLPNGAGGAIWAAIDDWFAVPQPDSSRRWHGYGEWGPLDGWRRPKPEYAAMARVFDPIQMPVREVPADLPVSLPVTNRFDVSDLQEVRIDWTMGDRDGTARLSAPPGDTAQLELPAPGQAPLFTLRFRHERLGYDRTVDVAVTQPEQTPAAPAFRTVQAEPAGGFGLGDWRVAATATGPVLTSPDGHRLPLSLALVPRQVSRLHGVREERAPEPLANAVAGWFVHGAEILWNRLEIGGSYDQAEGRFVLRADDGGTLWVDYDFRLRVGFAPLQTGVALQAPGGWDRLAWRRAGLHDPLPADHPGRAEGIAPGRRAGAWPEPVPGTAPPWPWALDQTAQGTNDFRSTKRGIERATLSDGAGIGIEIRSDGSQHVRAQLDGACVRLFVLDYSGAGSERFLESFEAQPELAAGDRLTGTVRLSSLTPESPTV